MTLEEHIEAHETWLDYNLDAWQSAMDKGSDLSADNALTEAAKHAAIITALRARKVGEGALRSLAEEGEK
jgi:hypothetical protein